MKKRILREGNKGEDVRVMQALLSASGHYDRPIDGHFGSGTKAAVLKFQRENNLHPVDGVIGPKTFAALGSPAPELTHGTRPDVGPLDTLAKIQAHLEKGTTAFHEACYKILEFDKGYEKQVETAAKRALAQKVPLYRPLELKRGIPWAMTACIHQLECNNNPRGTLHNGQLIIGRNLKTTIVPKGRGPFATWLDGALDAVDSIAIWKVSRWTIGNILKQCERFNGLGYLKGAGASQNSPYVYACTNINSGRGKYVRDGVYDKNAPTNGQVGCAAVLRKLEMWGEFVPEYASEDQVRVALGGAERNVNGHG